MSCVTNTRLPLNTLPSWESSQLSLRAPQISAESQLLLVARGNPAVSALSLPWRQEGGSALKDRDIIRGSREPLASCLRITCQGGCGFLETNTSQVTPSPPRLTPTQRYVSEALGASPFLLLVLGHNAVWPGPSFPGPVRSGSRVQARSPQSSFPLFFPKTLFEVKATLRYLF